MDKRLFKICIGVTIALAVLCISLGCCLRMEASGYKAVAYTAQKGDTLYGLASELGIDDWRRWSYDVQQENGMVGAGLTAGEAYIIFVKEGETVNGKWKMESGKWKIENASGQKKCPSRRQPDVGQMSNNTAIV